MEQEQSFQEDVAAAPTAACQEPKSAQRKGLVEGQVMAGWSHQISPSS
jgi:hypothetical protein